MKFFTSIFLIISFLYAENQYVSNKKYTYDEVTEILSDKIIENRKKIEQVKNITLKDYENLRTKVEELEKKVTHLTNSIGINNTSTNKIIKSKGNDLIEKISDEKKKLNHSEFEEIVIEKELYEKVN